MDSSIHPSYDLRNQGPSAPFFRPSGAQWLFAICPRLAPWAVIFRHFAAFFKTAERRKVSTRSAAGYCHRTRDGEAMGACQEAHGGWFGPRFHRRWALVTGAESAAL